MYIQQAISSCMFFSNDRELRPQLGVSEIIIPERSIVLAA